MMGQHFIHYNTRVVRMVEPREPDDPWWATDQADFAGLERPEYHTARATQGPATRVAPGDTIWVVAQLHTPWGDSLPPSLDFRIDVARVDSLRPDDKGDQQGGKHEEGDVPRLNRRRSA